MNEPRYLTSAQVAERLGITQEAVEADVRASTYLSLCGGWLDGQCVIHDWEVLPGRLDMHRKRLAPGARPFHIGAE